MKKLIFSAISSVLLLFSGCQNLDLNPLSEGSTGNWFSTEAEFEMALNELYCNYTDSNTENNYWHWETWRFSNTDRFTDDWSQREYVYDWNNDLWTADFPQVESCWTRKYAGVTRANTILSNIAKARSAGGIPDDVLLRYESEASFFRACFYSYLIFLWGDVPFYTEYLSLDNAFRTGRTDKNIILEEIYRDFDRAAEYLPVSYSGLQRVTKGAAYAFKARIATWMLDWATAADAAGECIRLNVYSLHPNFGELFLDKTRTSPELIFSLPRSKALMGNQDAASSRLPRIVGGGANAQPSWELLCAFTCTDGLPIDKSPLYDRKNPFKNRDPRLKATMVEIGSEFLGYVYDPGVRQVRRVSDGVMVSNTNSRLVQQYAAYNGMSLKKGVDEDWLVARETEASYKLMRYADVLLMYAEAKMELNEIDASVLEAVNRVRARGYGVNYGQTTLYPAVTETNQSRLRTIIRMERRVELAWENRRWFDLIRWRLAETAILRPVYCHDQTNALQAVIDSDDYFFPKNVLPIIDENGLVDLSPLFATGKIIKIVERKFSPRQYLLPIPAKDRLINLNMTQNDGY